MEFIKTNEQAAPFTGLIELNRPKELNALNPQLMQEVRDTLQAWDKNDQIRVIVITGNDQAFAAGADIKQMADKSAIDMQLLDQFSTWDQIRKRRFRGRYGSRGWERRLFDSHGKRLRQAHQGR